MKRIYAALIALAFVASASATPVTVNFTGTITAISDGFGVFDNTLTIGDYYFGVLTYDVSAPSSYVPAQNKAIYPINSDFGLEVSFPGYAQFATISPFENFFAYSSNQIDALGEITIPADLTAQGVKASLLQLNLSGAFNGQVTDAFSASSVSLPASNLDLNFQIQGGSASDLYLNIQALSVQNPAPSVPEPATCMGTASGLGLFALVAVNRRQLGISRFSTAKTQNRRRA